MHSPVIILIASLVAIPSSFAANIHVSPSGTNTNPGTQAKPVATLTAARDLARKSKDQKNTVLLGSGTYRVTNTFELNQRDSNTTYQAVEGEIVRVTGGVELPVKNLKPVSDQKILARLPESVRSKVVEIILPDKPTGASAEWPLRFRGYAGWPEIYIGEKALRLARWPNTGYAKISKVLARGSRPRHNEKPDKGGKFKFKEDNPTRWDQEQSIYLGGYWCFKWYDEFVRVKSIDIKKREIQMAAPHQYGIGGPTKGLYFAINLLEELDQPGEYVYDAKRHALYILLPSEASDTLQVSMLNKPLVSIKNAKKLSFHGIIFENGCDTGISISDCESVGLTHCTVQKISGTGVSIIGGHQCGVYKSRLKIIGKTAVSLTGGDRITLKPSKHFVTHSHISHFARLVKTYCPAVQLAGVGQIVANNYIHHAPHCAILFAGNDHQMQFNHIEKVCLDTSDAGAIYCGRDWAYGGNRIHGNFIHHLGKAIHHQNWAIYLDDMASGIEVSQNIVIDTDAGFLFGGGRSNVITDNLISNCPKKSILFDARAVGWAKNHTKKPNGSLWKNLKKIPYDSGIWRRRFPYLSKLNKDAYTEPRRNTLTGNRLFKSPSMSLDKRISKYGTVKNNDSSPSAPTIQLIDGKVIISEKNITSFKSMVIGPSK